MKPSLPRIEISLDKINENSRILSELYQKKGISLMGVSKAVLGEPSIINEMVQGGVKYIADSRIENIQKLKSVGIISQYVLMRTALSQAESVVELVDISLNTELETVKKLSYYANLKNKHHKIIIMVEMGDLREGILPSDLSFFIRQALNLPNIEIEGIGCNLACQGGIRPDVNNMTELSDLAIAIEKEFNISLNIVSGGNSANYEWYNSVSDVGRINNLRVGESILLGCETADRTNIPGLNTQAFLLVGEVIENKTKPSMPYGTVCQNAFDDLPETVDRGLEKRAIVALGRQDCLVSGMKSVDGMEILGSSSDHIILNANEHDLQIGDEVKFSLNYGALLAAMTSPYVRKKYLNHESKFMKTA